MVPGSVRGVGGPGWRGAARALLDAAVAFFDPHGVAGFSLRQVAERAGFAPPTVDAA